MRGRKRGRRREEEGRRKGERRRKRLNEGRNHVAILYNVPSNAHLLKPSF